MAIHNPAPGTKGRPNPQVSQYGRFPAPVNGIDSRVSFASNDPNVCIYAFNMVPSEYSLRVRDGYREWQIDISAGDNFGINTIIPFDGKDETTLDDRLFAVNNEGIWDVTIVGDLPVLVQEFTADNSPDAGRGTYTHILDDGDNEHIYYADSRNGLFIYSDGVWAPADNADIENIPGGVESINFVVVHKLRIWFGVRDSGLAYYLPPGEIIGITEDFNFGIKFKHGGNLVGMYNWTVDGGDGVDDYLIAVSRSGDVLPYTGSDPTQITWTLVGTYFIGAMARGQRCASQYGGNTAFLSTFGITQMSDLLRGVDPRLISGDSLGAKIAPLIRNDMRTLRDNLGWDIRYLQVEGVIIVTTPQRINGEFLQYVYNVSVDGWGVWRGPPIRCADVWNGVVYFGTEDGKVMAMDVDRDNVLLDPIPGEINGDLIEFSILHNYLDLDEPSVFKRGKFIRPDILSRQQPSFNAKFLYDYSVAEIPDVPLPPESEAAVWDISFWDQGVWQTDENINYGRVIGGEGIGRYISVAIKGHSVSRASLVSTDVTWDKGWFL